MSIATGIAPARRSRELTARDPFRSLQQQVNRLFEETFGPSFPGEETLGVSTWAPSCDIYETDNEIVLKAELPGVKKEDVKVDIENNVLTLRGERKFEEETKKENFVRIERSYGNFLRSFSLPTAVDTSKINAEFKDGILQVILPKREESKPKTIEVKVK